MDALSTLVLYRTKADDRWIAFPKGWRAHGTAMDPKEATPEQQELQAHSSIHIRDPWKNNARPCLVFWGQAIRSRDLLTLSTNCTTYGTECYVSQVAGTLRRSHGLAIHVLYSWYVHCLCWHQSTDGHEDGGGRSKRTRDASPLRSILTERGLKYASRADALSRCHCHYHCDARTPRI